MGSELPWVQIMKYILYESFRYPDIYAWNFQKRNTCESKHLVKAFAHHDTWHRASGWLVGRSRWVDNLAGGFRTVGGLSYSCVICPVTESLFLASQC